MNRKRIRSAVENQRVIVVSEVNLFLINIIVPRLGQPNKEMDHPELSYLYSAAPFTIDYTFIPEEFPKEKKQKGAPRVSPPTISRAPDPCPAAETNIESARDPDDITNTASEISGDPELSWDCMSMSDALAAALPDENIRSPTPEWLNDDGESWMLPAGPRESPPRVVRVMNPDIDPEDIERQTDIASSTSYRQKVRKPKKNKPSFNDEPHPSILPPFVHRQVEEMISRVRLASPVLHLSLAEAKRRDRSISPPGRPDEGMFRVSSHYAHWL